MSQPDILFFMSDQHTPYFSGFGGNNVDTPEMDSLCRDGINFSEAYSNCPLCVPARLSMLSSLRPAKTGIFTLDDALPDLTPTFLHYLVEQGYETVLCGRMHFVGSDQRHGFTKRIAHELTPTSWNAPRKKIKEDRGVLTRSFGEPFCTAIAGGGESTVEYYDRYVVDSAIRYLSEDHEKPQFIMVGLYGPHFPYVGDKELYLKYLERVTLPESFYDPCPTPVLARHVQPVSEKLAISIRAAYSAMVEKTDEKLGEVRRAFNSFCDRRDTKRLFIYTSDHGDQCGDRSMFAKSTFFEKSTKIPLIFAGDGVVSGVNCKTPVSIMDIGPTILEHMGAHEMLGIDGVSLASALHGHEVTKHEVYGEFLERTDMKSPANSYCFMLRRGDYKYMSFFDDPECELLFNVREDPEERHDLAKELPDVLKELREASKEIALPEQSVKLQKQHTYRSNLMRSYENALAGNSDVERWENTPPAAREYPEICIRNEALTEK